jgi:hypothetical protein
MGFIGMLISIAYIFVGLTLFSIVFADEELVPSNFCDKIAALSVFLLWPLWIAFIILIVLFAPMLKVFFNIDVYDKRTWIK